MVSVDAVAGIVEQWTRERPDLDPSPMLVAGRIQRVAHLLDAALRPPFEAELLGNGDFDVLAALRRVGEPFAMRPVELSRAMLVTTGAVTKRIDRLEAAGLVDRRSSVEQDARGKVIRLTPAGQKLVDRMIAVHLANEESLLAGLSASERKTLGNLLAKLSVSLESPPE
jgi:DNA-binding MarR family transcriptional regulator